MDPKMDGGVGAEGVYTMDEMMKLNLLPTSLSIPEVLGIIDRLLGCEVYPASSNLVAKETNIQSHTDYMVYRIFHGTDTAHVLLFTRSERHS